MDNMRSRGKLKRIADFLNEVGMLRRTPRSGYQFLGTGSENVAEHSYRTAVICYVLARMAGADPARAVFMGLFHDLHEARIGDFNYVNHMYNSAERSRAVKDALAGTGLTEDILGLWQEQEAAESAESRLARDADQLDLILNLKEQSDLGNKYADKWLESAVQRLHTEQGRELARVILETDHTDWWFLGPDASWWANKNGSRKGKG